jgi:hypothetical protein
MEVKSKRAEKEKINLHVFGTSCLEKGGKRSRMWEISSRKSSEEKITTMTITMTISTTTAATTATTTTTTTTISTTTAMTTTTATTMTMRREEGSRWRQQRMLSAKKCRALN